MNATEHSATNTEQHSILSTAVNGDNVVNGARDP
jgi:hypothetical protein